MALLYDLLGKQVYIQGGSHVHFLVITGEQMQNVHFVEQMQIVKFLIFPDWSIGQYRKI